MLMLVDILVIVKWLFSTLGSATKGHYRGRPTAAVGIGGSIWIPCPNEYWGTPCWDR